MLRFLTAAAMVVMVPLAVAGASEPGTQKPPAKEKRICRTDSTLGTRLGNTRRCRTKTEDDAHKAEARNTVDRMQAFKPTLCPPNC